MSLDQKGMAELLEASDDLHSDAMRATKPALDEVVELHHQNAAGRAEVPADRRRFLTRSLFAAGTLGVGAGAYWLSKSTLTVFADQTMDVQILQTSAALENLAIAVYGQAAKLPAAVSGASNPVIAAFVQKTVAQHMDHVASFNGALLAMNAKQQTAIDQKVMDAVVTPALAKVTGPIDVVTLALTLEDAAAQTYVKFGGEVDVKGKAFGPLSTIAPVEAQHAAVLLAVQALLAAGAPQLIQIPAPVAQLPAAAGDIGFPKSFYPTDAARPEAEGAVS